MIILPSVKFVGTRENSLIGMGFGVRGGGGPGGVGNNVEGRAEPQEC